MEDGTVAPITCRIADALRVVQSTSTENIHRRADESNSEQEKGSYLGDRQPILLPRWLAQERSDTGGEGREGCAGCSGSDPSLDVARRLNRR